MGSSSKKRKEKQKDFQVCLLLACTAYEASLTAQKPKLKVGKAKAKPENFTDTSFQSKCMSFSTSPPRDKSSILIRTGSNCSEPTIPTA